MWLYAVLLVFLLVNLVFFWRGVDSNTIEYSTFLEYVDGGYVATVKIINDRRIKGTYSQAAIDEGYVEVPEPDDSFVGSSPKEVGFVSTKTESHALVEYLEEYNRRARSSGAALLTYEADYEDNWLGGLLTWILPLAFLIGLWLFLMRRMNPGSQVLNIGKNKAVLFDAMGEQNITFRNVAGLDEAKEEVAEVVEFLQNPKKFTKLGGALRKGCCWLGLPGRVRRC